jgi:phosphate transport system permease protein
MLQFDNEVDAWLAFERWHPFVSRLIQERTRIQKHEQRKLNHRLEQFRLEALTLHYRMERGEASETEYSRRLDEIKSLREVVDRTMETHQQRVDSLTALIGAYAVTLQLTSDSDQALELPLEQIVRAYRPNVLSFWGKAQIYASRVWEFISDDPREANSEGGVFPAIFGTVLMVLLMTLVAVPFGVLAALYLREYAKQGVFVRLVRIAVNNLAGVPSIVYGMFGLGFFVYLVGGTIDSMFYPERLPSPTFGTGGILWASLTLSLLTVPVVIVATEEALAAIPQGIREGSLALGATKWETIRRVVLPTATPGIMTGAILAMARGAGEVAPLMITGVVKLAAEMPFDTSFPFFHLDRKFMHLGFHIYDVGFQTSNVEANIGMVYATTLLLICLILVLNLTAIIIRARLRSRFRLAGF